MPVFHDLPQPLDDGTVALRAAAERDIPEILIAHQDDATMARALGLERPPSSAELGRRTERAAAERAAGVAAWLTILAHEDQDPARLSDECRGQIDVFDLDVDHRRAQLTIWVAPRERRRGLGTAALALAARWLLTDVGLERVQLFVDPANTAMLGAAAAAGFRDEGLLHGHVLGDRGREDRRVLSLLASDLG